MYIFFFKQKTAYEMRISDWSSDVCSSDLPLYISIDLDGVDPSAAPGVAHPEPGGLTVRELLAVLHKQTAPVVGADIVELHPGRSEERRVGKECVSTCRSRWSPYH